VVVSGVSRCRGASVEGARYGCAGYLFAVLAGCNYL